MKVAPSRWLPFLHRLSAAGFLAAAFPAIAQEAAFRTGVNLVLLDVGVTDSKGRPVANLEQASFEVKDEGRVVELTGFARGSTDVSFALVVDSSGSMKPRWNAVAASIHSLGSLLQPGDEAELLTFHERATTLAARQLVGSMHVDRWPAILRANPPTGQTALFDAVLQASHDLEGASHGRRVIVVLSDGEDTASRSAKKQVMERLQASHELLYAIGLFEPGARGTDAGSLRDLAESTGGIALFENDPARLRERLESIVADLRQRYVLQFRSPEPRAGESEVRKLSITVRDSEGKRLKVRSRDRYRVVAQTGLARVSSAGTGCRRGRSNP